MNLKYIKMFVFGTVMSLFIASPAISAELVTWNNTVATSFAAQQCVTIHGIPGTPKKCAPSYTQKYPCPSFKHPGKHCHHTIAGPCSPGISGTPDVKQCANISLGNFSIAVDGGVSTESNGNIDISTTVNIAMFGKHATIPVTCELALGKQVGICLNLITRTFSGEGFSCKIGGAATPSSMTTPGVNASFCMDVAVQGITSKPQGSVTGRIEAGVEFGSATVAGHSLSMGSKSWNPSLFSVKF